MNYARWGKNKDFLAHPELLDIHVPRMIEAHGLVNTYMKDSDILKSGLIRLEGFFGEPERVAEEIEKIKPKDKRTPQSQVSSLSGSKSSEATAGIYAVVEGLFHDHMKAEVRSRFDEMTYLQHLVNSPHDDDDQKVFHSDTFFPCVKFWYFPKAVKKDDGAFWYVPYSPVLTDKLIDWHKARIKDLKDKRVEEWRGWGHKEGSLRISLEEIGELGLSPMPVEVRDDTLVIANVFGFHRRGDTREPTHRLAIHGSVRINNPFSCGAT